MSKLNNNVKKVLELILQVLIIGGVLYGIYIFVNAYSENKYNEEREIFIKQESQDIIKKLDDFQKTVSENLELANGDIMGFSVNPNIEINIKNIGGKVIDGLKFSLILEDNFGDNITDYDKDSKNIYKIYNIQENIYSGSNYIGKYRGGILAKDIFNAEIIPENTKVTVKGIEIYDIHFTDGTRLSRDDIISEVGLYSGEHYYGVNEKKVILNNKNLKQ